MDMNSKQKKEKHKKIFNNIEAVIMMSIDGQADAVYLATLMITSAKTILTSTIGAEKTKKIFEELDF